MATGEYNTPAGARPLIVYSKDLGKTWVYPKSVHENLNTVIDPALINATLTGAGNIKINSNTFKLPKKLPF